MRGKHISKERWVRRFYRESWELKFDIIVHCLLIVEKKFYNLKKNYLFMKISIKWFFEDVVPHDLVTSSIAT